MSVRVRKKPTSSKSIKMSRKGRRCRHSGCVNILSVYNHEAYCHAHYALLPEKTCDKE